MRVNGEARYTRLAMAVSPAGSVRSGSDSPPDCHSIPSRRFASLHYPERAQEVSLRLGHASGLTVHRTVIQYLGAASLLRKGRGYCKG